jgi:site-specific DNA recombinase
MKKGVHYIRVSDERQLKGYSPDEQRERLSRYYITHNIECLAVFAENDSASGKDFYRPAWNDLRAYCKANKDKIDFIHIVDWSRFARNTEEAYITIRDFRKLGIEINAIEQLIDYKIPEQKYLQALYLAAPDADNHRRAINVIKGMRRAMMSGRWVNRAPVGYKNKRDEEKRAILVPDEKAKHIRKAFELMAQGIYCMEEVRIILQREDGFQCSKNNFPYILQNPLYAGRIFIPAHEEEPAQLVPAIHEPLISEDIFQLVQDIITGRRKPAASFTRREEFPLRGYLICSKCTRKLTGSASRGRTGTRYHYYHCDKGCKVRFPASALNQAFEKLLQDLQFDIEVKELYREILKDLYKDERQERKKTIDRLQADIDKNRQMIAKTQDLLAGGQISLAAYQEMNERYQSAITEASRRNAELERSGSLARVFDSTFNIVSNLQLFFQRASLEIKQMIIVSIFPGKLSFDGFTISKQGMNEVVQLLCGIGAAYEGNEKGQGLFSDTLPTSVVRLGLEPRLF